MILRVFLGIVRAMSCLLFVWVLFGFAWFADYYFSKEVWWCTAAMVVALLALGGAAVMPTELLEGRMGNFATLMSIAGIVGLAGFACQTDKKISDEFVIAAGLWAALWLRLITRRTPGH